MTEQKQVYKCEICGNIVEVLDAGGGELVCCGQPMKLLKENSVDAALEKHVPVIETSRFECREANLDGDQEQHIVLDKTKTGFKVKVGSVAHPMLPEHHIEWIELIADGKSYRQFLNPEDKPEAEFCINAKEVSAREYCNLHGLWKSK